MPENLKATAQAFANKLAVRVFPFRITADGKKQPLVAQWNRAASRDASKFSDEMWAQADGYGVMPDGYTVLDFDSGKALAEFGRATGNLDIDTMVVSTPRGTHVWFRGETRHVNGLVEHVDVRSGPEKGYIIGPGSYDPNRNAGWEALENSWEVAQLPARIREYVMNPGERTPLVRSEGTNDSWDSLLGQGRNVALTALKGTLIRKGIPESVANNLILAANSSLPEPLPRAELDATVLNSKREWEGGELELPLQPSEIGDRWLSVEDVQRLPPPSFIIDPIFPEGTVNVMFGPPGSYKSFIALDWAARITSGQGLPGMLPLLPPVGHIAKTRRVLYVAAEGVGGLGKRVRASDAILSSTLRFEPNAWAMNVKEKSDMLRLAVDEAGIQLIFFDTLRKTAPGADENSVQDMGRLMSMFEEMSVKDGVTVVLVHHSNRGEGHNFRGSSTIEGDAYNMWKITQQSPLVALIETQKFKDAEPVAMTAHLEVSEAAQSLYVAAYGLVDATPGGPAAPARPVRDDPATAAAVRAAAATGATVRRVVEICEEQGIAVSRNTAHRIMNSDQT